MTKSFSSFSTLSQLSSAQLNNISDFEVGAAFSEASLKAWPVGTGISGAAAAESTFCAFAASVFTVV